MGSRFVYSFRFSLQTQSISLISPEKWDNRERSPQCGEACIFVLNEVCSRFDPVGALARALCLCRIKFWDASVLSDTRFSNMSTEWGGYHLHLLFESLLDPLSVLLWCLSHYVDVSHYSHGWRSIRIGVFGKRTSVVRRSSFVCPMSHLFVLDVVTLTTFPLVLMLRKGPFHLEQRIYGFVLPGLWRCYHFCCL